MTVDLSFVELSEYVASHFGHNVAMRQFNESTLCIGLKRRIIFRERTITICLTIESATDTEITLSYNAGTGMDFIMRVLLNWLKTHRGELMQAISITEGGRIIKLNLALIPRASAIAEALSLNSIAVTSDSLRCHFSIR